VGVRFGVLVFRKDVSSRALKPHAGDSGYPSIRLPTGSVWASLRSVQLDDSPVAPDLLGERLEMPQGRVALSLAKLEVRGLAVRKYGGYEISERGARVKGNAMGAD
jgi:hypothetical protein